MNPEEVKKYLATLGVDREDIKVTAMPEHLPWVEGKDYETIPGDLVYNFPTRHRDNTGESFDTNPHVGAPPIPQPNTPNNPYFGKQPLETKDFYALVGRVLSAARFKRLITDSNFLWVGKVLDHVEHVDPDDKAGQFLQIIGYLQNTNGDDAQKLITAQEVAAIMVAWP